MVSKAEEFLTGLVVICFQLVIVAMSLGALLGMIWLAFWLLGGHACPP